MGSPVGPGEVVTVTVDAPVVPVSVPTGASGIVQGGAALLAGWSLRETTGAAVAQLDIIDGSDATGQLVASIALAAGASDHAGPSLASVLCRRGVFVHAVAGSVAGALWLSAS